MFKIAGVLLLIYIVFCLVNGEVFAKYGPWGRTYTRTDNAIGYWGAIGSYSVLTVALFFVF